MTRQLYDFQAAGVEFLAKPKKWAQGKCGGFLWDDPGLGKTTQAIQAAIEMGEYPILVVCPNALKRHWRSEIKTMSPDANVVTAVVGGRLRIYSTLQRKITELSVSAQRLSELKAHWVIVHYAGLRVSEDDYAKVRWATVIIDEAHYVKNRKARRTQALWNVTPHRCNRLALTATPYSKEPSDMWAQMFWMAPQVEGLQNYWRWFGIFTDFKMETIPGTNRKFRKVTGGKNLDLLAQVMAKYGRCRRKAQVASQLPPITDTLMPLELEGRQGKIYKAMADATRSELAIGHTGSAATEGGVTGMVFKNAMSRMTKMEQWLSNPQAVDPGTKGAKMAWLEEWAKYYTYPAVIVTRFKSTAKLVASVLGARPVTGDIPIKLRGPIIEQWSAGGDEAGDHQFLVGTIHTLGTGLNLERAHCMICYDQVYSPILMTQVRERIHRITSKHPVEVIYLVVEGTTNELVYESFQRKWKGLEMVKRFLLMLCGEDWRSDPTPARPEEVTNESGGKE